VVILLTIIALSTPLLDNFQHLTKLEPIATTIYHFATYYVDDFNNELQFCGVTDEVIVDEFKYH
jgi:hypothetical protein